MLKKCENAFIIISLIFIGLCGFARQETPKRNLDFLAEAFSTYFDRLLQRTGFLAGDTVFLVVENRIQRADAVRFVRDLFIEALNVRGVVVRTQMPISEPPLRGDRIELAVESWRWQLDENRNQNGTGRYMQSFTSNVRILLIRSTGEVQDVMKATIQAQRTIKDLNELYLMQANQPDFAIVPVPVWAGKRKIIETILITVASAITIYLLFHIRSQ
ncbi:MAG: hypothetical protein Q9P90_16585 [candidate division KSB1 bacterium]|nr:hypothetical protein [candidate division KSB1 bacterium]